MFPFFARFSLSSFFWAWSFTLGVGSQFSQIGLGQFEFSGSFGIFQLRHRRSRRMDRWPLFPRPCKKGLLGFLRSFLVRFWSLPKNLWTTCMLISGLSFKLLLNRAIFLPFGPVRKFRIRIMSTGCFFVCLWGCFPLILSPESKEILGVCSKWFVSCCLVFPFYSSKVASSLLVDKLIALMAIFFSLGPWIPLLEECLPLGVEGSRSPKWVGSFAFLFVRSFQCASPHLVCLSSG